MSVGFLFVIYFELGRLRCRNVLMFFLIVMWFMYRKIGCVVLSIFDFIGWKMLRLMLWVYSMMFVKLNFLRFCLMIGVGVIIVSDGLWN